MYCSIEGVCILIFRVFRLFPGVATYGRVVRLSHVHRHAQISEFVRLWSISDLYVQASCGIIKRFSSFIEN